MSIAVARNSGPLSQDELGRLIIGRNANYLLATRKAVPDNWRVVHSAQLLDTRSWGSQRWFPEHELWYSLTGIYLVLRRAGTEILELYKGPDQQLAIEAYNGMAEVGNDMPPV